jgi:hypothetical protein
LTVWFSIIKYLAGAGNTLEQSPLNHPVTLNSPKRSALISFTIPYLRYQASPLMCAMSASCSAFTRSNDSYSARNLSSSRLRSRAVADFTAAALRLRSAAEAAWLRFPTARSFSRSIVAA